MSVARMKLKATFLPKNSYLAKMKPASELVKRVSVTTLTLTNRLFK